MRILKHREGDIELKIIEHIMTQNAWEYYVIDDWHDKNTVRCLVMGFATEIGDVYLPEIQPYIITRTKDLRYIMPAEGYDWKDTASQREAESSQMTIF